MNMDQAARKIQEAPSHPAQSMVEVLPRLLEIIFAKHPAFVEDPEKGKFLLGLRDRLARSSYTLGVKDDKDIIAYRPRRGDELGSIRRGALSFSTELGLQMLTDQTIGNISLQNRITDPNDPAELQLCNAIVIHVQERNPSGPIAEVRRIAGRLNSHWLESAGFNSRLLRGLNCTVFDCVVMALSPFGVVREDLPGLRWDTPASGIKNIRRRFFANNPDLTSEINQTEYPERLHRMTYAQLRELRTEINGRMSRANMIAWRLDGYRHVREFRSLILQEVGERCFPFMTLPIFPRVGMEARAAHSQGAPAPRPLVRPAPETRFDGVSLG
jgi:hypothetical protein